MNKRGNLVANINTLIVVGIMFVVLGVASALGADVQSDVQADYVTNTAGCNATVTTSCGAAYQTINDTLTANLEITDRADTVATVAVIAIILGLLLALVGFVRQ